MAKKSKKKGEMKRVKLYIDGFDEQIEGGVPEGYVTLICGTSGTMKSSLGFNVLYNEALNGKTGLYVSLEQSAESLLEHAENMGYDMSKINLVVISDIGKLKSDITDIKSNKGGSLIISDLGSIRKQIKGTKIGPSGDWLNVIKNIIKKLKEKTGCDLFVLDSLSALYVLSSFDDPRTKLFYIFEFLRDIGLTTFLISEMPLNKSKYSEYEVEDYLADGIILLQLTERFRKVVREISIVKMRATNCNTDVFTLEYKNKKFYAMHGGKPPLV
jgi:KaiC/GvpD/RAD55 family RecA-like ATPase